MGVGGGGGCGWWIPSKNLVTSDRLVRVIRSRSESVTKTALKTGHFFDDFYHWFYAISIGLTLLIFSAYIFEK